ncbi:WYL domain-containing protein [bacterium]|nr:WYL domain-containing protein [bacterium]
MSNMNEYDEPFFDEEDGENIELTPEELGKLEALAQTNDIIESEEQILPEEVVLSPLELIVAAIAHSQHLQIEYMNRHGEIKQYIIEPYEIGSAGSHPAGYLWAWDVNTDGIKSFFLSNISDVQLLETIFVSRF